MRAISYYLVHTFRNIIRKLFKSAWGIFVIVMIALFVWLMVISLNEKSSEQAMTAQEQMEEQEEQAKALDYLKLGSGGLFLLFFLYEIATGEKKGSGIFQMPDVNLLFASPMRPQTILMFRIVLQMAATLLASIYMLFQIPNLMNMGLKASSIVGFLITYFIMLALGMIVSIFIYCIAASHPKFKAAIRPTVYIILGGFTLAFVSLVQFFHNTPIEAGMKILKGRWFHYIPLIGWLQGFFVSCLNESVKEICIYSILLLCSFLLLLVVVYRMRVDFYEDAMTKAQKTQELINASKEGRTITRNRSEKVRRDESIGKGIGASAFYYKEIYNHSRFAKLHIFTASSNTYYIVSICLSVFLTVVLKMYNPVPLIVTYVFIIFAFSKGSTISTEMSLNYLYLVPEDEIKKILFCALADLRNFLLDSLIAYGIGCVILRMDIKVAVGSYFMLFAFYYIATQMGAFIDLLLPSTIATQFKAFLCLMLRYLAMIPAAITIIIFYAFGKIVLGMYIAAVVSFVIGGTCMAVCPYLLRRGKK